MFSDIPIVTVLIFKNAFISILHICRIVNPTPHSETEVSGIQRSRNIGNNFILAIKCLKE